MLRIALALILLSTGCVHRQAKYEREWNSIWESWQIEVKDDCDYINSFHKADCLKRHNVRL